MSTTATPNHIGKKICRIRELRGIKQETLAMELGISQQSVSKIEKSETIDTNLLVRLSIILGVTPEGIENFDEQKVLNIINNTNQNNSLDNSTLLTSTTNQPHTYNTDDKIIELYERFLEVEKSKVELLEKLLNK